MKTRHGLTSGATLALEKLAAETGSTVPAAGRVGSGVRELIAKMKQMRRQQHPEDDASTHRTALYAIKAAASKYTVVDGKREKTVQKRELPPTRTAQTIHSAAMGAGVGAGLMGATTLALNPKKTRSAAGILRQKALRAYATLKPRMAGDEAEAARRTARQRRRAERKYTHKGMRRSEKKLRSAVRAVNMDMLRGGVVGGLTAGGVANLTAKNRPKERPEPWKKPQQVKKAEDMRVRMQKVARRGGRGLFSGLKKRLFGGSRSSRRLRTGLAIGGGSAAAVAGGGAYAYNRKRQGKSVLPTFIPAKIKNSKVFQTLLRRVKQRFPDVPEETIKRLIYQTMKEKGVLNKVAEAKKGDSDSKSRKAPKGRRADIVARGLGGALMGVPFGLGGLGAAFGGATGVREGEGRKAKAMGGALVGSYLGGAVGKHLAAALARRGKSPHHAFRAARGGQIIGSLGGSVAGLRSARQSLYDEDLEKFQAPMKKKSSVQLPRPLYAPADIAGS